MHSLEDKKKIEAVLFAVGKDIAIEEVARLCRFSEEKTLQILQELKQEYDQKDSSLHLIDKGKFWKFSIRDQYLPLVSNLVTETELDKSTMETLAVIAWKYPVLQADVIKIRHNKAYDHMKHLEEAGFIAKEKSGRTFKLKLTEKFFNYFDLPSKDAKEAFKKVIPEEIQKEIIQQEQEIEQKEKELEEIKKKEEEQRQKYRQEKSEEQKAKEAVDALDEEEEDKEMVKEPPADEAATQTPAPQPTDQNKE